MKCRMCGKTEVIKICKPEHVKFKCSNKHTWTEDYVDKGGVHHRPESYEINIEDILFPGEKVLYRKVLKEMEKNQGFYLHSTPEEIASHLIDNCKFDKEGIYILFKKISTFNKHAGKKALEHSNMGAV